MDIQHVHFGFLLAECAKESQLYPMPVLLTDYLALFIHFQPSLCFLRCAFCQMVKPLERNTRYVDAVMTIPKGTLFPMCGMNLAFDRQLIGPAMYFGLMGEGQPIGRYDDMWAGWCSKVSKGRAVGVCF